MIQLFLLEKRFGNESLSLKMQYSNIINIIYFVIDPQFVLLLIIIIMTCENPKTSYVCLPIYCMILEIMLKFEKIEDTVNNDIIPASAAIIIGIMGIIQLVAMSRRKRNAIKDVRDVVKNIIIARFVKLLVLTI